VYRRCNVARSGNEYYSIGFKEEERSILATGNDEMKKATFWMLGVAATGALAYTLAKKLRGSEQSELGRNWVEACEEATKSLQLKMESYQKAS
jgi:hypothetical protein